TDRGVQEFLRFLDPDLTLEERLGVVVEAEDRRVAVARGRRPDAGEETLRDGKRALLRRLELDRRLGERLEEVLHADVKGDRREWRRAGVRPGDLSLVGCARRLSRRAAKKEAPIPSPRMPTMTPSEIAGSIWIQWATHIFAPTKMRIADRDGLR